ncbi:hypothetical protein BH11PSE3_BH11PSE3_42170 [soil metagenome]
MRKVIREAQNKGKPNKQESVEVDGVPYRSVWAALQALRISGPPSRHEPFRLRLKNPSNNGKLSYSDRHTNKTYRFRLIPYNAKL